MASSITIVLLRPLRPFRPLRLLQLLVPEPPRPAAISRHGQQPRCRHPPAYSAMMIIHFLVPKIPLHQRQRYGAGSRHRSHHHHHPSSGPTIRSSRISSDQSMNKRPQPVQISYAHRAVCMTRYFGHFSAANANATVIHHQLSSNFFNECRHTNHAPHPIQVHIHARLPNPNTPILFKKEPNVSSAPFLPCQPSSRGAVTMHVTLAPLSFTGKVSFPTSRLSRSPSARHRLPSPRTR